MGLGGYILWYKYIGTTGTCYSKSFRPGYSVLGLGGAFSCSIAIAPLLGLQNRLLVQDSKGWNGEDAIGNGGCGRFR